MRNGFRFYYFLINLFLNLSRKSDLNLQNLRFQIPGKWFSLPTSCVYVRRRDFEIYILLLLLLYISFFLWFLTSWCFANSLGVPTYTVCTLYSIQWIFTEIYFLVITTYMLSSADFVRGILSVDDSCRVYYYYIPSSPVLTFCNILNLYKINLFLYNVFNIYCYNLLSELYCKK